MKSYTITVNGNVYDVTVEENGSVSAPAAAPKRAAAPVKAAAPKAAPAASAGAAGSVKVEAGAAGKIFKVEKKVGDKEWINGGFFVCEKEIFDYIDGDDTIWERAPLESIAKAGKLFAYKHNGFWKPMDTLRDKMELEALWESGNAPWKA